jgi:hypothetical protein
MNSHLSIRQAPFFFLCVTALCAMGREVIEPCARVQSLVERAVDVVALLSGEVLSRNGWRGVGIGVKRREVKRTRGRVYSWSKCW